jgi:hypothetical protein
MCDHAMPSQIAEGGLPQRSALLRSLLRLQQKRQGQSHQGATADRNHSGMGRSGKTSGRAPAAGLYISPRATAPPAVPRRGDAPPL